MLNFVFIYFHLFRVFSYDLRLFYVNPKNINELIKFINKSKMLQSNEIFR